MEFTMKDFVEIINSEEREGLDKYFVGFCNNFAQKMKFNELNENNLRYDVWSGVFKSLKDDRESKIHSKCLETLRILSRDGTDLNQLVTDDRLNVIIDKAGLSSEHLKLSHDDISVEALKLLCNLIYNAPIVQIQIPKTNCLNNLVKRLNESNNLTQLNNINGLLFDMRILFLITALNSTTRNKLKDEINADMELINMLDKLSQELKSEKNDELKMKFIELICEILKALFNLYIDSDDSTDNLIRQHEKLVDILYKLLSMKLPETLKKDDLHSHIVNLLTVIPLTCFGPIIPPANLLKKIVCHHVYEKMDMTAINQLLIFLDKRLNDPTNLIENISPVVTALLRLVKSQRLIRKWTRMEVLPSLKEQDVMHRPEEDDKLRGKLCKLLTNPVTEIRDLVAEFLFVLCKENVGRMIKYTGYGNAAGMFAKKGLLGGKQGETEYSSESGESDTEEYAKYREDINPVTGCYEQPKRNPFEGMSEEQKEHEAMKLVGLIGKLTDDGLIQPCTVGEDGKPKPVEHVLELQEGLPNSQKIYKNNESDSD